MSARGAALLISGGATFPNLTGKPDLGNTGFLSLGAGTALGTAHANLADGRVCGGRNVRSRAVRLSDAVCTPWAAMSKPPNFPACGYCGSSFRFT